MIKRIKYVIGHVTAVWYYMLLFSILGILGITFIMPLIWVLTGYSVIDKIGNYLDYITFKKPYWYHRWINDYK